jgi:thiol-disulfide isomerase/thioredoxin
VVLISRRAAISGAVAVTASLATPAAGADDSPVAHGLLLNNKVAKAFHAAPRDTLPDVEVVGPDGVHKLADLIKGRTVVMPLWAEWCAPCLSELPDFAKLQRKYGSATFAVIEKPGRPTR